MANLWIEVSFWLTEEPLFELPNLPALIYSSNVKSDSSARETWVWR